MAEKSGLSAKELFERGIGLSYLDFTVLDTFETTILKSDISLATDLGKGVVLQTPIMAAPMDKVTNAELCIALALEGGVGVIHYNHKDVNENPDIDAQIKEIERVKRFSNGFIEQPIAVSPAYTIDQVVKIGEQFKIGDSRIDTFPVTEDGSSKSKLVGLLRKQDYSRTQQTKLTVGERMLPLEKLIFGTMPMTLEDANQMLWDRHLLYLPIVDGQGNLQYLVTRADVDKNERFPLATKDEKGRLRTLFAVDTWMSSSLERLERGFAAGADGAVVDTSQGFTIHSKNMLIAIAEKYPDKLLIGGNVSTKEAAMYLANLKLPENLIFKTSVDTGRDYPCSTAPTKARGCVDVYRNGQGPGSICTTAGAIGISRSGASGIYDSQNNLNEVKSHLKTIADGGIKEVGDGFKAFACGAHCIMLGKLLAGTDEAPGKLKIDPVSGMQYKEYRGMGSAEANVHEIRGYGKLPQGVSGIVEYRGSIHKWVPLIRDGLLSAFEVQNCLNIDELHEKLYSGELRFERRAAGAIQEAGINIRLGSG